MLTQFNQILNENICYFEGSELHGTKKNYRDVIIHYDPSKGVTTLLYHKDRYPFEVSYAIVNKKHLKPNPHVNDLLLNYRVLDNAYPNGNLELRHFPSFTLNALYVVTTPTVKDGWDIYKTDRMSFH